ncbi:hypothetical protein [Xanthovirga aplysinae]|uniref:hypothetical protein n=1 Tax=Xanthovirga aplysinae TaxID=2529853 RepID=UPI0012BD0F92|nr:hypothetical protein [Xanthovirga aplysinae]MTI31597.1 hypothetical protein [Xanthovirga aplysinae]
MIEINVNLDELTEFCKLRGIKNDGKARYQFLPNKKLIGFKKVRLDISEKPAPVLGFGYLLYNDYEHVQLI